jgi:hypothetical protein
MNLPSFRTRWPVLAFGLVAGWVQAQAPAATPIPGLTPVEMRGIWFAKSEIGAAKCASYLGTLPAEPEPGALVVSEKEMVQWGDQGSRAVMFVTDVRPRRPNTWRFQALLDLAPHDRPKVLETYVLELRKNELHWSSRHSDERMTEKVDTAVFERCGY